MRSIEEAWLSNTDGISSVRLKIMIGCHDKIWGSKRAQICWESGIEMNTQKVSRHSMVIANEEEGCATSTTSSSPQRVVVSTSSACVSNIKALPGSMSETSSPLSSNRQHADIFVRFLHERDWEAIRAVVADRTAALWRRQAGWIAVSAFGLGSGGLVCTSVIIGRCRLLLCY